MTFLLNPQTIEDMALITVTIYHRTGRDAFMEASRTFKYGGSVTFEKAYEYAVPAEDHPFSLTKPAQFLEHIFRTNNAVDGSEVNVALNKRSLSVGDVVEVVHHFDEDYSDRPLGRVINNTFHEVAALGFQPVESTAVKHALWDALKEAK